MLKSPKEFIVRKITVRCVVGVAIGTLYSTWPPIVLFSVLWASFAAVVTFFNAYLLKSIEHDASPVSTAPDPGVTAELIGRRWGFALSLSLLQLLGVYITVFASAALTKLLFAFLRGAT